MKNIFITKNLGDVCSLITRGISPLYTNDNSIDSVPVLNQRCIRDHNINYFDAKRHNIKKKFSREKLIQNGDVLINSTGVGTLGRIAQVKKNNEPTVVDSHITIIRPTAGIFNLDFFGWMLIGVENLIQEMGTGSSGQIELSRTSLKEILIAYPESILEQKNIALKLDKKFSHVNDLKEIRKESIINTEKILTETLKEIFENGQKNGWKKRKIMDVCNKPQYGFTASANQQKIGPKMLRITDIQKGMVDWTSVPYCKCGEKEKYELKKGDILFARTGATVGKSFLINEIPEPAIFASYLIRITPKENIISEFIYYFFQSQSYWSQIIEKSIGAAQPNVNGTKLAELELFVPSFLEQKKIVKKIDKLSQKIKKLQELQKSQLEDFNRLEKAYLKEAFSGKLK